jgi:gliding motility-associated-like protein
LDLDVHLFNNKTILITGGTGFFGRWLLQILCTLILERGFRINIFRKGVKILSKTLTIRTYEYRFFTFPKDSVCAVVYALNTYCKQDSIASDTICGNSRECAVFGLTRANISRDTSICPTSSATIRLDTASLFDSLVNDQRLGKNPEFSADSGKTWQRTPNFTVSRPSKNVTSLFITYRDANRCISGAVVEAKVSLLRYTPGTGVSIVGQSEICNRNRNDLSLTKTGDNLTYTWSVIKGFGGFTTPTGTVSSVTADVASYKPGIVPGSDTLELGTITIAARNSCFDIYDTFSFILTKAPIGVFVVNPASLKGPGVVLAGKVITFDVIGGLPGETYTWNFDDGTPVVTSSSLSQTHTFEATGIVNVKLTVLGSNGCSTDVFLKITITTESISGKSIFFIPNAFAPNSAVDGVTDNTRFKVYGDVNGNKPFEVKIFDGWGKLVYTMISSSATWDGSSDGNLLPAGNYTYTVKCTLRDGTEINQNGTVSLIN